MSDDECWSRRRLLAAAAAGAGVGLAGCSGGSGTPTPSPSPSPSTSTPSDPGTPTPAEVPLTEVRTRAQATFRLTAIGAFEDVSRHYEADFAEQASTEKLRMGWANWSAHAGRFLGVAGTIHTTKRGFDIVHTVGVFASGLVAMDYVFDDGEIQGYVNVPPQVAEYAPPEYADANALTEREVTLAGGSGDCERPGTLTLPEGSGRVPGVVLVHGSGPHDRDGTVGPNKPYRDLALGLAGEGVATLRYEKRTAACDSDPSTLTLDGLVVDDAVAAVERLRSESRVDAVGVCGHGLGGMVAPRVVARSGADGMAALAAPARPLPAVAADGVEYVADLDGEVVDTERAWLDRVAAARERIESGDLAADETALGHPGAFWSSVADHDPVAAAADLSVPRLFVHGGRDFLVSEERDFGAYREAVDGTFETVDAATHLLIPGKGSAEPAPSEHAIAGNVSAEVVASVSGWANGL